MKKFKLMDAYVNNVICRTYDLGKDTKQIVLGNFDLKNRNHLCVIRVILTAKQIFNFDICMNCGAMDWLRLNWRARKLSKFIKNDRAAAVNFDIKDICDTLSEFMSISFDAIYAEYYEGDLG